MWYVYYLKIILLIEMRSLTFYQPYSQAKYLGWSLLVMAFYYISLETPSLSI